MNGTTTESPLYPQFFPGADRQLLADISRWRKANGWHFNAERGWINAQYLDDATIAVDYDQFTVGFHVERKGKRGNWPLNEDFYPADSIRETVDMLVAIGILPQSFASAYRAGREDAAADVKAMDITLGDAGWKRLEVSASDAGYPGELVRNRRRRDDFTTCTIEAAYQYGYRTAAKVAAGGAR